MIVEGEIHADTGLTGRRVAEVAWPQEAVLVAIERHDQLIVPRGDLRLAPGDRVSIFAAPAASAAVEALLRARAEPPATTMTDRDDQVVTHAVL